MDPIVHFEIPFDNQERVIDFYRQVFKWDIQSMPEMKYVIVRTGETDEKHMLKKPGMINGGMFKRTDMSGVKNPVITINVKSIDHAKKEIEKHKGKMIKEKFQVSGMGYAAYFQDTEGNIVGLWENLEKN
jgi:uncharacterized protein